MSRFYEKPIIDESTSTRSITVEVSKPKAFKVAISEKLSNLLNSIQREHWMLERRESRHSVHVEAIPERFLHHSCHAKSPEQLIIEQIDATEIAKALRLIPVIQRRRFLLMHLAGLSVKQIAQSITALRALSNTAFLPRAEIFKKF